MRILSWSIGIVLGLAIILFALSNRQPVDLGFWPLDARVSLPLFAPVLACAFVAFFLGGIVAWVSGSRWRRTARRRGRRIQELELRIRSLEERLSSPTTLVSRPNPPALRQIPGGRS